MLKVKIEKIYAIIFLFFCSSDFAFALQRSSWRNIGKKIEKEFDLMVPIAVAIGIAIAVIYKVTGNRRGDEVSENLKSGVGLAVIGSAVIFGLLRIAGYR